jgi:hypothetical protein
MRPRGENVEYDKLADRHHSVCAELIAERKRVAQLEAALQRIVTYDGDPTSARIARDAIGSSVETQGHGQCLSDPYGGDEGGHLVSETEGK